MEKKQPSAFSESKIGAVNIVQPLKNPRKEMASTQTGNSGNSKAPKKDKKRHWKKEEEEALLEALKALVVAGWKSDNGFRGGYMGHLEVAMRKAFPTANIKEHPHI